MTTVTEQIIPIGIFDLCTVLFCFCYHLRKRRIGIYQIGARTVAGGFGDAVVIGIIAVLDRLGRGRAPYETVFIVVLVGIGAVIDKITVGIVRV